LLPLTALVRLHLIGLDAEITKKVHRFQSPLQGGLPDMTWQAGSSC